MPEEFRRELREAGARLLVFRPEVWRFPFRRDRLRRMHRKIAVADGRVAFVGGINIIDDMDTPRQVPPRYDYAVKIEGPLVARVQEAAVRLWNRIALARRSTSPTRASCTPRSRSSTATGRRWAHPTSIPSA